MWQKRAGETRHRSVGFRPSSAGHDGAAAKCVLWLYLADGADGADRQCVGQRPDDQPGLRHRCSSLAQAFDIDANGFNNHEFSLVWGHPQGPTGLRRVIEMIEELVIQGGGAGLFIGGADGDSAMAVIVEVKDR